MDFYCYKNIVDTRGVAEKPWEWYPGPDAFNFMAAMPKLQRRAYITNPICDWKFYTPVVGTVPWMRVKAEKDENQPAAIRGFVVDYDTYIAIESLPQYLAHVTLDKWPTYAETSLSGKLHAVWVFKEEVKIDGYQHAQEFFREFAKYLNAETLLPGWDDASTNPTQLWQCGCKWFATVHEVDPTIVQGIALKSFNKVHRSAYKSMDLDLIAGEVERRFPGRWRGDFIEGAIGVRFWDPHADNQRGAMIKQDGCFCLTGDQAFVSWEQIFGKEWINDCKVLSYGKAAENIVFDDNTYWCKLPSGEWVFTNKDNVVLELAQRGVARSRERGDNMSEVERVLRYVQVSKRVAAAIPLVFTRPGLTTLDGEQVLNISNIRALTPVDQEGMVPQVHYPFIWSILNTVILGGTHARDTLLAWMKIAYEAAYNYSPIYGQALFIFGPKQNGKTLICNRIIVPLLGGKQANPFQYMTGQTDFSDDLFKAGVLAINDEEAPNDNRQRTTMLQRLKALVANGKHTYHPKYMSKSVVEWYGRVVITGNDDPNSQKMLVEVNSNTEDKVIMLATQNYGFQWPSRRVIEDNIAKELPFFARGLLEMEIAPECLDSENRAQVKSYQHPLLLAASAQQERSYNLVELLQIWMTTGHYWKKPVDPPETWEGNPTGLMHQLTADGAGAMENLLREWSSDKVAVSLGTLARQGAPGISYAEGSERKYVITKELLND